MNNLPFHGSYLPNDVSFLLKPIDISDTDVKEKERLIQTGIKHYSELISKEYSPSEKYLKVFHTAFARNKIKLAQHVLALANELNKKNPVILVSLARAGTPIAVLLKRTLRDVFNKNVPHYSISIIRDRGIDENALRYILSQHNAQDIVFIDGWTGKGVIARELQKWVSDFNRRENTEISTDLYVIADISGNAAVAATTEDYLIPSSLLNATISGLVSRSILNENYVGADDFHGCKFYTEQKQADLSLWYVSEIMAEIQKISTIPACADMNDRAQRQKISTDFIQWAMQYYGISQINFLKPGMGEAIRVLLRRVPYKILIQNKDSDEIAPFLVLAAEKNVPVEEIKTMPYKALGIIKLV